jgi:cell division protein FtsI/penicillin-binding protein 2
MNNRLALLMKLYFFFALFLGWLVQNSGELIAAQTRKPVKSTATARKPVAAAKKAATPVKKAAATPVRKRKPSKPRYRPAPPVDPTLGDNVDGEDLEIRRAAVDALGTLNGSVVVVDPTNGRVLTMVNQKLALTGGYTPCSTIKLMTSLAALSEHVVSRDTFVPTGRRAGFNMTNALARSDNKYFAVLGTRLGFDRIAKYSQMLGLGELAGLNIPGEQAGTVPSEPPKWGGVGMMTSFGEGFLVTPLELAAMISALANGGTLYYLQYPRTPEEVENFEPKVKRELELTPQQIEDVKAGMRGAVDFGTARRAYYDASEPVLGKTGTCTDFRASTHMGWFGSFNEVNHHKLVVVVMLTGTKTVNGPVASGVAGAVYRKLSEQRYFAADTERKPALPDIVTSYPRE